MIKEQQRFSKSNLESHYSSKTHMRPKY